MVTREPGLVMPIGWPRETISGTVVDNPKQYENVPRLDVATFHSRVPFDAAATGSLQGAVLETPHGQTVPAEDRRVTAQIPALTAMLTFVVRQLDEPRSSVKCDFPSNRARNLANTIPLPDGRWNWTAEGSKSKVALGPELRRRSCFGSTLPRWRLRAPSRCSTARSVGT